MDNQGWIKDYRKEIDSDIWAMPPLYFKVWQYLKYMANHQVNSIPMSDGSKEIINRGQHLTSYRSIAKGVSYYENRVYKEPNAKTIKKILEWLEKNHMITLEHGRGNKQYTKITLVNYSIYQSKDDELVTEKKQQSNSEETAEKQQSNTKETEGKQTVDINKNDKNDIRMNNNEKEGKEEYVPELPSISFPTETHRKIFNETSDTAYRTFFIDTEIIETDNKVTIKANSDFIKEVIINNFKDKLYSIFLKEIEVI
ncbi:hypothetical protein [Clostridium tertium]|uniref:hypothetical protein n=1 Tax=Clostridium tertium TaxID=1559 RepID=UPI002A7FD0A7|nr:hypothetical protein [Clostridium tertium]MDY4606383.1 hypothetical protein [Clostridium tertium]